MNLAPHIGSAPVDASTHEIFRVAGLYLRANTRGDDGMETTPEGAEPAVADQELFKILLEDNADNGATSDTDEDHDPRDADRRADRGAGRQDARDEVTRALHTRRTVAREATNVSDIAASDALDVAAVSVVVTRVYLENSPDRERVVHLALDEALLPATRLTISERDGRLAVDFVSMNTATRHRLCRCAPSLAQRVAGDLSRDVLVKVAAHEHDRLALEVGAAAPDTRPAARPRGALAALPSCGGIVPGPSPDSLASLLSRRPL